MITFCLWQQVIKTGGQYNKINYEINLKCEVKAWCVVDYHVCLIYCFHSTGLITVAPGVQLTVGRNYALTVEAIDNGPLPHRRWGFLSLCVLHSFLCLCGAEARKVIKFPLLSHSLNNPSQKCQPFALYYSLPVTPFSGEYFFPTFIHHKLLFIKKNWSRMEENE